MPSNAALPAAVSVATPPMASRGSKLVPCIIKRSAPVTGPARAA